MALITAALLSLAGCSGADTPPAGNTAAGPTVQIRQIGDDLPRRASQLSNVLIQCRGSCESIAAQINTLGGRIEQQYRNTAAVAAVLPADAVARLETLADVVAIEKNSLIERPRPVDKADVNGLVDPVRLDALYPDPPARPVQPNSFRFDGDLNRTSELHEQGIFGNEVIVAIIDSGTANNPDVVPALAGSIIGGESFVPDPDEPSATSTLNDDHGTWVATMIAGHARITLPKDDPLAQSILFHAPQSATELNATEITVPLVGSAPGAKIYTLKVFAADQDGTPRARTLAALDRVLTLKRNFNNGVPSVPVAGDGSEDNPFVYDSLDIKVLNISLGGPTLFPGYEIEDRLVDAMLEEGIVVTVSAGNAGFAAMTGDSPGTSFSAITVGAANDPVHERILRDQQLGPGAGLLYRPNDILQIAEFSSRGPTAGGQSDPDLVANGVATYVQGADGHTALVSGTSFSAPTVAGAAALLWELFPDADAAAIREALIAGANADLVGGNPGVFDQGAGFLDVAAARQRLAAHQSADPPEIEEPVDEPVPVTRRLRELDITPLAFDDEPISIQVKLGPGEVRHFFLPSNEETAGFTIDITEVTPELPPEAQNQWFGDDLMVTLIDAPTSVDMVRYADFVFQPQSIRIEPVQTGLLRLAVMGDWTNAGDVTARLLIQRHQRPQPAPAIRGTVRDGQTDTFELTIPAGLEQLNATLSWPTGWAYFPAHDLDLVLMDPAGTTILEGVSLASPERVTIDNPPAGTWTVMVDGYELHGLRSPYAVTLTDSAGQPLRRLDDDAVNADTSAVSTAP